MPVDPSLEVEATFLRSGHSVVIGMDEVGRGAVAGPVAVGVCAITDLEAFPLGLRDSKLLSEKRREALEPLVQGWGVCAVGWATAEEICDVGIVRALGLAGHRGLTALHEAGVAVGQAMVLLDGSHDWLTPVLNSPLSVVTMVKADQTCASVAGASVVAKVARDALMRELAEAHPEYGWESNKGYGAATHMSAISQHGATTWHRTTWLTSVSSRASD